MNGWASGSASQTISTRPAPLSHRPWQPLPYMVKAAEHLVHRGSAALFMEPGLRKTSITLAAFDTLRRLGLAKRMLVIAPLRVCQSVWRQEGQKWTEFRHLRFSLLHGKNKEARLKDDADIWLINPEGIPWLAQQFFGRPLAPMWDTVVIDELTKFKNAMSDRFKLLRPRLLGVQRRWGLTGSPIANGYMDLHGEMLILDDGAALGRFITAYRDAYFSMDFDGFSYNLMPGAEARIQERIAPYVLCLEAADYMQLPAVVPDIREITLDKAARKTYRAMLNTMVTELPGGTVTAANTAAMYSKLKQLANGAVYIEGVKGFELVHNAKLDALEELMEELDGKQLLLAYEFRHDFERIKAHFGDRVSHLGSGMSEKATLQTQADWNAGKIKFLACHPASAGHGLNLQESHCAHICWFSPIWDFELYDQFTDRIHRSGNEATHIIEHILVVKDSLDEDALQAIRSKDTTQGRLIKSLKVRILHDAESRGAPATRQHEETTMPAKLSRAAEPSAAIQHTLGNGPVSLAPPGWGNGTGGAVTQSPPPPPTQAPAPPPTAAPPGWGGQAAAADDTVSTAGQRENIRAMITGAAPAETAPPNGRAAFSQAVQETRQALETAEVAHNTGATPFAPPATPVSQDTPAEPKRTRTRRPAETEAGQAPFRGLFAADKVRLLGLVFSPAFDPSTVDEGLQIANELVEWINGSD